MDWAKLVDALVPLKALVPPAIALVVGVYVGRLGFSAEVMKLRHAIAVRRVRQFDEAATAFLSLLEGLDWTGAPTTTKVMERACRAMEQFCEQVTAAMGRLAATADLALAPGYAEILAPMVAPLAEHCYGLAVECRKILNTPEDVSDGEGDQYSRSLAEVRRICLGLMEAVDVSVEAKLEGRSPRRLKRRIRALAKHPAEGMAGTKAQTA